MYQQCYMEINSIHKSGVGHTKIRRKQKRLDVDWKLACSGAELKSFCVQDKVSGGIELLSSIGIGSADTNRRPNGGIARTILTYFQITQPGSGNITLLYLLKWP